MMEGVVIVMSVHVGMVTVALPLGLLGAPLLLSASSLTTYLW